MHIDDAKVINGEKGYIWTVIDPEVYNALWHAQKGRCAICGKHQTEFKRKLCLDHDHETGKVRALLCTQCNTGLGMFKDDFTLLINASLYLKKHGK